MKPAFRDRAAAGAHLAAMLEKYKGGNAVVLAIPAGGVPVGAAIARELGLPVHAAPVSKVLYPWTTESGFGAVAFDGSVWIDEEAAENSRLTKAQVEKAVADARAKVERRTKTLSSGKALTGLSGKTVILVDDGIAAGSTMRTAIAALRKLGAGRIVVAVPTAPSRSLDVMRRFADEIVCPNIRGGGSFAVADAYEEWRDLSDDEVEAMLKR
ncbi:MAG TPA: phosphoribosyltransferase family protein [Burkholderiales bacterium]|nr:phosphoribosyltransferase family protein [Burkholderiales bacterium]